MKVKILILSISMFGLPICQGQEGCVVGPRVLPHLPGTKAAAKAYDAYRSGRSATAVDLAWPLADKGDVDALFLLGFFAEEGEARGSKGPSRQQSMELFYRKAEQAGSKEAVMRSSLASVSFAKDDERADARRKLEQMATDTEPASYRILGEAWGRGLMDDSPNREKMKEWWRKAAELGDIDVLIPLGEALLNDKDEEGMKFLNMATRKGLDDAYLAMGMHEENRDGNPGAALRLYREGAEKGHAECMFRLAVLLSKQGASEEGEAWLGKAAAAGCPMACTELGKKLAYRDVPDYTAAYPLLLSAAKDGIWQAQYQVAMMHLEGKGRERDPVAAAAWLARAMTSGDPETLYQLALLHEKGLAGPVNYSNAGLLYSMASRSGHADASYRLAIMALEGYRIRNLPQAWAYASMGVKQGSPSAKSLLSDLEKTLAPSEKQQAEQLYAKLNSESIKRELR